MSDNYIEVNRSLWDERVGHHISSDFYNMAAFMDGQNSLNDIELSLLGDVSGKSILHLQCHFGQDTLSLARMGAKVIGVDFSPKAIEKARELNDTLGLDAAFICCDIYELPSYLYGTFDIVFTSYGTIGWLPDMSKWAAVVSKYMGQGSTFIMAEFHPVVWMYSNDLSHIQYPYFNRDAIEEMEPGTYTDQSAPIEMRSIGWNHNLAEVIQALTNAGLQLKVFSEYDYSPYNVFKGMTETAPGKYSLMDSKLPLVYSLKMEKM